MCEKDHENRKGLSEKGGAAFKGTLEISGDPRIMKRVYLWYQERFGYEMQPYQSLEQAISTWPSTLISIGVKPVDDRLALYIPFGLNDMFGQIVRANKTQITEETFLQKSRNLDNCEVSAFFCG